MATRDNVLERYENIIKSANDDRFYRGLVLTNKMKVLLISDPTIDKSAAALDVNIGYTCNTDDLSGLAHFCKHTLLLKIEKYPVQTDYANYLWEKGGKSNACTHVDHTTYFFEVNPTKLAGALDRFAQFFLTPIYTDISPELELTAIHSEYLVNQSCDNRRFDQLERSSANPRHPFSKFSTGNRETLNKLPTQMDINVRQRLLEFYEKYYSSNVMSLCVLGAETLDELEEMVVNLFSQVRNKEIEIPICREHPLNNEHFRNKWYMVPIKNRKTLHVAFPIPDLQKHYQSKPTYYIKHLLELDGRRSLSLVLQRRGWCKYYLHVKQERTRCFSFFIIVVRLTEEGVKHVDDIITVMFQYINMIKEHGPIKWIYNEYRDLAKVNFHFTEKQDSASYVSSRASKLRDYQMQDILWGDVLFSQWNPELVDAVMKYLTPRNIRVYVIAKEYEGVANKTERWFNTKYKKEKIPIGIIDMWENAGYNSEFHLPARNDFITMRFDLKPWDDKVEEFPTIIADTSFVRLWFKRDDEYLIPKAKMFIQFVTPYTQMDAISFILTVIYGNILQDSFTELMYQADLGGLNCSFDYTQEGITLRIFGYDDKQQVLLEKIVDSMLNFKIDPEIFEIFRRNYLRCIYNDLEKLLPLHPHYPATCCLDLLLEDQAWTRSELLYATTHLTLDRFEAFIPQLFSKVHVECLIHGNMMKREALDIATMIEAKLKVAVPHITPLGQQHLMIYREVKLNDGRHFWYQTENKFHKDSCTGVYYQIGMQSTESNMLLELLCYIINAPCVNILQTQEQLGAAVSCEVYKQNVMQGLLIAVQSDKDPRYVEQRIECFVHSMLFYISVMLQKKFAKHRDNLPMSHFSKVEELFDQTDMFWEEITKQTYNFDRANIETAYLKTVTQEQLLNFFKENIHGPNRRKLSLHLVSTERKNDTSEKEKYEFDDMLAAGQVVEINNIFSFKRRQSLCAVPESCVPKKGIHFSKL